MSNILLTYSALLFLAVIPIYFGAFASNKPAIPGQENETFNLQDAKMFPVYGSISLLSLYLLFKYFDKNIINYVLTAYFIFLGLYALASVLLSISRALTGFKLTGDYTLLFKHKKSDVINVTFGYIHLFYIVISITVGAMYVFSKHWILSNIYGLVFSFLAIETLKIDSFKTGMTLLSALFFYDIFWVFGTDVMVSVAKNFDAPIKILWPKDFLACLENGILNSPDSKAFSLLGLGDIVLPGVYVALCLRYDYYRYLKTTSGKNDPDSKNFPKPYFKACFISYILGLATCMGVMHTFKAAQPALLYLSPACILSTLVVGLFTGELAAIFEYSEDEESKEDKKKATKKTKNSKDSESIKDKVSSKQEDIPVENSVKARNTRSKSSKS